MGSAYKGTFPPNPDFTVAMFDAVKRLSRLPSRWVADELGYTVDRVEKLRGFDDHKRPYKYRYRGTYTDCPRCGETFPGQQYHTKCACGWPT